MSCRRGTGRTQGRATGDLRLARTRATWLWQMVAGTRMRETRTSGSERGQGTIVDWIGSRASGCGAGLNNTQEVGGGSPAGLAKKRDPHDNLHLREALPYSP